MKIINDTVGNFDEEKVIWLEHARIGKWLTRNPWRLLYSILSRYVKVIVTSRAMKNFCHLLKMWSRFLAEFRLKKSWALPAEVEKFLRGGFVVCTVCSADT